MSWHPRGALRRPRSLVWSGVIAAAILGVLPFIGAVRGAPAESIGMQADLDNPYVMQGARAPVYVVLRVHAPERETPDTARPPLNLALVLDRSGSMHDDGKMEYLRPAARLAAERLDNRDFLSVVEYDDHITLMWPAARAGDTRALGPLIDQLEPRGSTNLAGGLERGIAEAGSVLARAQDRGDGRLSRVLLLSDGLANVGITDPAAIGAMVRDARRRGIRVSAMGLGRDYDEDLMQHIAEMGGGNYYYVEHPKQLTRIFEQELKTAFTTVARDVRLVLEGTPAVTGAEIIGLGAAGTGPHLAMDWDDIYAGEERSVVLRLDIDPDRLGPLDLGRIVLAFTDAEGGAERVVSVPVAVTVTRDTALLEQSVNPRVKAETLLVESDRAHAAAMALYDAGQADQADAAIEALRARLETENATLNDARLANKIEGLTVEREQMAVAASPAAQEDLVKAAKQRLFEARIGKRTLSLLEMGTTGLEVERLQRALQEAGVYEGAIDGVYDEETRAAVETFQARHNIRVDGVAGPVTMDRLGLY